MLEVSDAPLLDPITSGMFDLLDGRSPAAAGEIVMSPRVLDRLDAEIGDEIEISSVGRLAIVGTVEQPSCLACDTARSEEHTSELQSLMRISYAVFCLKKKK